MVKLRRDIRLPSVLHGMARVLDIGDQLDRWQVLGDHPEQEDAEAIGSDWKAVGEDLLRAAESVNSK